MTRQEWSVASLEGKLLLDHERPCQICGNGAEAHFGARLGHPMPPPPWKDTGSQVASFRWPRWAAPGRELLAEDVANRGFFGRLRWLVFGR